MRTLVYKRTHPGDPDVGGRFGNEDCMGQVRSWQFDAVIGVGGIGSEPRRHGIAGKVNWISIGPRRVLPPPNWRGPLVTFKHFLLEEEEDGPDFDLVAPTLAKGIYSNNVRVVMRALDTTEQAEIDKVLTRAWSAPPSPAAAGRAAIANKPGRLNSTARSPTVRKKPCGARRHAHCGNVPTQKNTASREKADRGREY
jgi:hypothetical protein